MDMVRYKAIDRQLRRSREVQLPKSVKHEEIHSSKDWRDEYISGGRERENVCCTIDPIVALMPLRGSG